MVKTKSYLQEAIATAKEVREAAVQHAYKELEENLTPSIKEALAQKLEEDFEVEDLEEGNGAVAGFKPVKEPKPKKEDIKEEDEPKDEETEETGETEEKEETVEEPEEDSEVPEEEETEESEEEEETETEKDEEPSDDTELKDLTLGDLKELISTMISAIAPEKPVEQPEDMVPADVQGKGEEETPIEAEPGDEEELKISDDETTGEDGGKDEEDVEIDLNELLKELESEEHDRKVVTHKEDAEFSKELDETKAKLNEALDTIAEMKETLANVNLLNAKLNSAVKLLSKPLKEGQRARVFKSLDEAQSAKEVKVIHKTLTESFKSEAKKGDLIKEHKGSASRAAGKSTAAPIVEVDPMVKRFQQLAGIIK